MHAPHRGAHDQAQLFDAQPFGHPQADLAQGRTGLGDCRGSACGGCSAAFAERERAVALATMGEAAWLEKASQNSAVLTARFSREPKHRFNRAGFLAQGYAIKDVDAFSDRLLAYLLQGEPLSVADVRSVTFRAARGGYDEAQVDAVLDAVVDLLLSLGNN